MFLYMCITNYLMRMLGSMDHNNNQNTFVDHKQIETLMVRGVWSVMIKEGERGEVRVINVNQD